jgi:hydrogenase nickel incorporation protein HypB
MEIKVLKDVLAANESISRDVNTILSKSGVFTVNMMSSPGSGKTTILERTAETLGTKVRMGVIAGDVATTRDAERLSKHGIPVLQIDTNAFGGACHLEAEWVRRALASFNTKELDLLFIENVGNLICPSNYNIGEHARVVVLSVTEGEDKPVKYPAMFSRADAVVINKTDLLPHLEFDMESLRSHLAKVAGNSRIFELSAKSGKGFDEWIDWLKSNVKKIKKSAK